ncbi:MAG: holo-ACP synthase [Phycisphaeraceae bacterium]
MTREGLPHTGFPPIVLGHGVDLTEVSRVLDLIEKHGESFLERCFTQAEAEYASDSKRFGEHLAARFAAKEAVLKALGTGLTSGISWQDIEVIRSPLGKPNVRLSGRAHDIAAELGITDWHLSLSHTAGLAMASVIATGPPRIEQGG